MTGPELKQLRVDLGEAIGQRLSTADMARICGLAPANGADTIRKWEDGAGPSGPVAALLSVFAYAIDEDKIPDALSDAVRETVGYVERDAWVFTVMMRAEIIRRLS
jgi:hypothetical protein